MAQASSNGSRRRRLAGATLAGAGIAGPRPADLRLCGRLFPAELATVHFYKRPWNGAASRPKDLRDEVFDDRPVVGGEGKNRKPRAATAPSHSRSIPRSGKHRSRSSPRPGRRGDGRPGHRLERPVASIGVAKRGGRLRTCRSSRQQGNGDPKCGAQCARELCGASCHRLLRIDTTVSLADYL